MSSTPFIAKWGGKVCCNCRQPIRAGQLVRYGVTEMIHVRCRIPTATRTPEEPRELTPEEEAEARATALRLRPAAQDRLIDTALELAERVETPELLTPSERKLLFAADVLMTRDDADS